MAQNNQQQRGMTNREAAEDLERGGLKRVEAGSKSLRGRSRAEDADVQQDIHGHPTRKNVSEDIEDFEVRGVRPGEAAGRTRSAHVTNPNKKRKKVA